MEPGSESRGPLPPQRRRWGKAVTAVAVAASAASLAVALSDTLAALAYRVPRAVVGGDYESRAILEFCYQGPVSEYPWHYHVADELLTIRTRILSWNNIRGLVLGGKAKLGRQFDPSDESQLRAFRAEVERRCRMRALDKSQFEVSYHGPDPEVNASIVNELVYLFVGEDRRERQRKDMADLKRYRIVYAEAAARLAEIDGRIREFMQANPWLRDRVEDIEAECREAVGWKEDLPRQAAAIEEALLELCRWLPPEATGCFAVESWPPELLASVAHYQTDLRKVHLRMQAAEARVSELRELLQRAPALLAQRKLLDADRTKAAAKVEEAARWIREIERTLYLISSVYFNRFRVVEYARPGRAPFRPWPVDLAPVRIGAGILTLLLWGALALAWAKECRRDSRRAPP